MRPIHAILPAIVGALVGCRSETDIVSFVPVIAVQPAALDYGEVVSGDATPSLDVLVANLGRADLIADLTLEGEDAAAFSVPEEALHLELPPDGSVVIPVTFAPTDLRPYAGVLAVTNNDVKQAVVPVPLSGIGRVPYAPDIAIEPTDTLDLGTVAVGEDETGFFQVRNLGDADLVLGTITQSGAGAFHLDQDYSGVVIAPGQARPVVLTYTPFQAGGDSGAVHIPSNDPDEPLVDVTLLANGGGTFAYPEAVIDCPGQVDLAGPIDVPLDGSASTDPGGQALTWDWSIARRPSAADQAATPDPTDTPATTVRLDAAGTWEVQLVVTNEDGVPSVPTKCVIDAVPLDDLHVELSWGGPTSDLDLHLADGTSGLFEVPGDTSFCNPNPDWGTAGQSADDPRLDLDDDEGFGPENINVPAPAKGTYAVRVHLFDDVDDGAVTARVTVFTYGTAVWSGSQVMRRNEVWEVGQVNWPDGTFGVGSEPLWNAGGTRSCE
ncbi:MAG: choice-of-anchor D domain-containing protein [Alphaproteobacteria bacterium]|nr:choice-of-anchor D domain-containing protein [Alphaproteobacteria bacterium]